jgi:hypothetical protein
MDGFIDIAFDCLPLRSVGRIDVPLDASPAFRTRRERLKEAIETHGTANTYYLFDAHCVFRLANSEIEGMLRFNFDGTVFTDASDARTSRVELRVSLAAETCGGVPAELLPWLTRQVENAVRIEFDRYIAAGSLQETLDRLQRIDHLADASGLGL